MKPEQDPEQTNEMNSPRQPQHASRPIIVGHRPMMPDPTVRQRPDEPGEVTAQVDPLRAEEPLPEPTDFPLMPTENDYIPPLPSSVEPIEEMISPKLLAEGKNQLVKKILRRIVILILLAAAFYGGWLLSSH